MDTSSIWKNLMAHIKEHNINSEYICDYCVQKFHKGIAYCVLNNLFVHDVPDVIASHSKKFLYKELKHFKLLLKWVQLLTKNCLKDK